MEEKMIEKFDEILKSIEDEKGEVNIFALLKMDDFIDKWTIIFCADWATDDNREKTFNIIRKNVVGKLTPEEMNEMARIAIYPKTEHLIEELMQYETGDTIDNKKINGNIVHKAHIIKSKVESTTNN